MTQLFVLEIARSFALGSIATLGFAIWFNVSRRALLLTGAIGGCATVLRFVLLHSDLGAVVASFWASLFVGIAGYLYTRVVYTPRVVLTVPSIIPMIPGIPAYESLIAFFRGDMMDGVSNIARACLVLGALAGGLTLARVFTLSDRRPE